MSMGMEIDIKEFTRKAFGALGGLMDDPNADLLDVFLPRELAPSFGGRDFLRLDFSPTMESRTDDGRELFAVGSSRLDRLTELISKKGILARAYLNPTHTEGANLDRKLSIKFRFIDARASLRSRSQEETAHALFHFKVSFLTDDKTERLDRSLVNLSTGIEQEDLLKSWDDLFLDPQPNYVLAPFSLPPLRQVYEMGAAFARRKLPLEAEPIRRFQEKALKREMERIDEYFANLLAELGRKRNRARGNEEVRSRIENRRRSIEIDHAEKRRDVREKFRLDVRAELVNLLIVRQPWTRAVFGIAARGEEIERPFFWNPVTKNFLETPCDLCGSFSAVFRLRKNKLVCSDCYQPK